MYEINARQLLSDTKFFESYSRFNDDLNRYETWNESVERVMDMHRKYYASKMSSELLENIDKATEAYKNKIVLGAQRALQFGGDQILKKHMKLYNCTSSYADRPAFFNEIMYVLLCGAGAGFSVQKHHVEKLPEIQERKKMAKIFVVPDSIEGWADAVGVLLSSFFVGGGVFPEYEGRRVYFELSNIRPKGAKISGGFKAPGPEPLRKALDKIEYLIQGLILKGQNKLRPIDAYDIVMHSSDAVLAGGVRRSATIALFSLDDEEMSKAKTGNWFEENPQRARSNNSAVIIRNEITKEKFNEIFQNIKEFGEPGFAFFDSREFTANPCFEIGKLPSLNGVSGWQGCNLTEINGGSCVDEETFYYACEMAAIIGTLQAGYTKFPYLGEVSEKIFEREALLGVSITGFMNNPAILLNEEILKKGAEIVKQTNKEIAELIGINPAARTTCTKPSGNASTLLMTASGIHGEHSKRYLRNAQLNKDTEVAALLKEANPYMIEDSVWSASNSDYIASFPIITTDNSVFKQDLFGVELLKRVKKVQQSWVEYGTNVELCVDPRLRHNVSNTVSVRENEWEQVRDYVFNNMKFFTGISFLPASGDKDYFQAPFIEVMDQKQLIETYGVGAMFASGLIVDGTKSFSNLWRAIDVFKNRSIQTQERLDNQNDWLRRFEKFAENYFEGDLRQAEYCLKDVYIFHKWHKIQQNYKEVNFVSNLERKKFTDVDTLGAVACSGGACEIF